MVRSVAILLLMALPLAGAQDVEDGCTQSDPCPWVFDVDAAGISDGSGDPSWEFTAGDWVALDVFNFDEAPHSLAFGDLHWDVGSYDQASSAPFQVPGEAGTYLLMDSPSGDSVPVMVLAAPSDAQDTTYSPVKSIPAPGLPLVALALVALVAARRA